MAWKGSGVRVPSAPPEDGGLHLQAAVFGVWLSRAARGACTRRYGVVVATRIARTGAVATTTPAREDGPATGGSDPRSLVAAATGSLQYVQRVRGARNCWEAPMRR